MFGFLKSILKTNSASEKTSDQAEVSMQKIRFELSAPQAKSVTLTGDFNGWDATGISLRKRLTGTWFVQVKLLPGKYQYKFIVDGQWRTDPLNENTAYNEFGTLNSVVEVCLK